jgi:hypothetical protein
MRGIKYCALIFCALFVLMALGDTANARGARASSGHSSKNASNGYFSKACKTKACFKKHPDGHYSVSTSRKHKKG